jgi:hypothetical protein
MKIKRIEKLDIKEDTGCLTVKDPRHNHNFALSAGVFVKNSADGRGSQIETVGGDASGFTELDDVFYFARKLFRSLKYPISRVNAGQEKRDADVLFGGNQTSEITRDEIKWAKFLERQQQKMCDEFLDLFLLHLNFRGLKELYGIDANKVNVKMNPPSHYKKQMDQAFLMTSFDNYNTLSDKEEISKYFCMKKYLGWDDEEIRKNADGFKKDRELGLVKDENIGGY